MSQTSLQQDLDDCIQRVRRYPTDARVYVHRGMAYFKLGRIQESIQDFDRAESLNSAIAPYLWQRGLSYYYADRFADGARQFEIDLTVNAQDVEETVWRCLCMAQLQGVSEAQAQLLPVQDDPRPIMSAIYQLFAGMLSPEQAIAQGQSAGAYSLFYAHLYVGLFHEARGDAMEARSHLIKAASGFQTEDYMGHLARVHCTLRGWLA